MSTVVDDRVVEMRFDNKQFEANVKTSMSTLDKLKKSLNLNGASKGLENLGATARKFDTSGMAHGIDTVRAKFSALQVMGTTALVNITNSAVNAGKRIVSALTIDPIKSGFQEYETQMNAVQTILANTQSKGTTLSQVNAALDELNYYADKTIYNFTEMTRNIGTFTAAGIDLDTSVSAIQGIANLAAVSGSTSQQASTAMYQLSQALAAGTVKLMDWNSVVNAGMGGEVFQNALKETSRLLGTGADAAIEAQGSFRESLSTGWLTAEVLTETLKKFTTSGANEYVAEYTGLAKEAVEAALEEAEAKYGEADAVAKASKALAEKSGKNEEEIKAALQMAKNAEDAATKVKTFTQLWDTMKEAAQSGWAQTWRLVVGDFEEAKEFFTDLSDTFGGIIEQSSNARNEMLEGALRSNWDKIVDEVSKAGIETEVFTERIKAIAKEKNIDVEPLIQEYGSLGKAFQEGAISSDILTEALSKLGKSTADLSLVKKDLALGDTGEDVKQIQQKLSELGYSFEKFGIDGKIGSETVEAIKAFQELKGLEVTGIVDEATLNALKEATTSVSDLTGKCKEFIDNIDQIGGRELLLDSLHNGIDGAIKAASVLKEAWGNVFPPITSDQLYGALTRLKEFSSNLIMSDKTADKFRRTMNGLFSVFKIGSNIIGGGAKFSFEILKSVLGAFDMDILDVTANVGDAITKFSDWIETNNLITKGVDWTVPKVIKMGQSVAQWVKSFKEIPSVQSNIDKVTDYLEQGLTRIDSFIKRLGEMDSFSFENIFKDFKDNVIDYFLDFGQLPDAAGGIGDFISKFVEDFKSESENAGDTISGFGGYILNGIKKAFNIPAEVYNIGKETFVNLRESLGDGLTGLIDFMDKVPWSKLFAGGMTVGTALGIKKALGLFDTIASTLKTFKKLTFGIDKVVKSINKVVDGVGKLFKSMAFEHNTKGVKNLAISIAILVGAVAVLTQLDIDDAQQAVKIIAELALILGALAIVTSKMSNSSITIGKKGADLKGLSSGLAGVAAAVLMLAFTVKLIGNMRPEEAIGGFAGLIVLVGLLGGVFFAFGKLAKGDAAKNMDKAGIMLRKMATAMLLMVAVVKLISMLESDELVKGAVGIGGFVAFVAALVWVTKDAGSNIDKLGGMMIKISSAMALLVGVVKLISGLSWNELGKGAIGITAFAFIIKMLIKSLEPLGSSAPKIGGTLLAISVSIGILAGVAALLGGIDVASLFKGVIAVGVLGLFMSTMILATKNADGCVKNVIALSFAIGVMVAAVVALSILDGGDLLKATGALSALMISFAIMSKLSATGSSAGAKGLLKIAGVIGIITLIAVAVGAVMNVLKSIGFDIEGWKTSLQDFMDFLVILTTGVGDALGGLISGAISPLAGVLEEFGNLSWDQIGHGLSGMGGALAEVGVVTGLLGKLTGLSGILGGGALLISIQGLGDLADAFPKFGSMDWDAIAKGLVGMGGALTEVGTVTGLLGTLGGIGGILGGVSIAMVSDNLESLADAFQKFGSMDWDEIGKGLGAMGGALGETAIGGIINSFSGLGAISIGLMVEPLGKLADSVKKWTGVTVPDGLSGRLSSLATGVGAFNFTNWGANAITEISTSLGELSDSVIKWAGVTVPESISTDLDNLATGVGKFNFKGWGADAISKLATPLGDLADSVSKWTTVAAPANIATDLGNLADGIGKFNLKGWAANDITSLVEPISSLGTAISTNWSGVSIPTNIGDLADVFTACNNVAVDNVNTVVDGINRVIDIINTNNDLTKIQSTTSAIQSITSLFQTPITANKDGLGACVTQIDEMIGVIEKMAGLDTSGVESFKTAISALGEADFNTLATTMGDSASKFSSVGSNIGDSLASGLEGNSSKLSSAASELINSAVIKVSEGATDFTKAGTTLGAALASAISGKSGDVANAAGSIASTAAGRARMYYSSFYSAGSYIASGLASGIRDNVQSAANAAAAMASAASEAAKTNLHINSPSKVFMSFGASVVEGFAKGIHDNESDSVNAAVRMVESTRKGFGNALSVIGDIADRNIDVQPTIRPVLDLSGVQSRAAALSNLLNFDSEVGVSSNVKAVNSMMKRRNQNGKNDDVVSAISGLQKDLRNIEKPSYNINGVTYNEQSDIAEAIMTIVQVARQERRA